MQLVPIKFEFRNELGVDVDIKATQELGKIVVVLRRRSRAADGIILDAAGNPTPAERSFDHARST